MHNAMPLVVQFALKDARPGSLDWLVRSGAGVDEPLYHGPVVVASILAGGAILYWFHRLPYSRTPEESLQEAIEHHYPVAHGVTDPQN
jgi:hypothetical protein